MAASYQPAQPGQQVVVTTQSKGFFSNLVDSADRTLTNLSASGQPGYVVSGSPSQAMHAPQGSQPYGTQPVQAGYQPYAPQVAPPPQGYGAPPLQGYAPGPAQAQVYNPVAAAPMQQGAAPTAPWQPTAGQAPGYQGSVPTEPVMESEIPTAPPAPPGIDTGKLPSVPGYEGAASGGFLPPPSYEDVVEPRERQEEKHLKLEPVSDDVARQQLAEFASQNCCWGKGVASDMQIMENQLNCGYHYVLETYTEKRSSAWSSQPYTGQAIDGPQYGASPSPWEIPCKFQNLFANETYNVEVPHTANVSQCHGCGASGFIRCHRCQGLGRVRCVHCHGRGQSGMHDNRRRCISCHGMGVKSCQTCLGDGRTVCQLCQGYRQLKNFIQLTILFQNHQSDHIVERTDMPAELVRNVTGDITLQQIAVQVFPITSCPDREICDRSQALLEEHKTTFLRQERLLQQRQTIRAIPVSEIKYRFKGKEDRFWIYGKENKVHLDDYPQKACWGCEIM